MKENQNGKWLVISCAMLSDELKAVYRNYNADCKVLWMKKALHKYPQDLKKSVQSVIDEHQEYESILLTYGLCGNGTLGIKSERTRLVIPRFHDCIHQLAGEVVPGHLYLTKAWTSDQDAIFQQSRTILKTYGAGQGAEILHKIYDGYTDIDVIDTGSYEVEPVMQYAKRAAIVKPFHINQIQGSTAVLEKLLTGRWDEDFICLEPGEELTRKHFEVI